MSDTMWQLPDDAPLWLIDDIEWNGGKRIVLREVRFSERQTNRLFEVVEGNEVRCRCCGIILRFSAVPYCDPCNLDQCGHGEL